MKKHQTDTVSLVFAVIFLGVVCWWLVARFTEISIPGFGLMVAGTLITAGVVGLISALRPRKPEPAAPSHTPGLFEAAGTYEQPVESGARVSFQGMNLHGGLSEEEQARADALLAQVDAARTRPADTVEFPAADGATYAAPEAEAEAEAEATVEQPYATPGAGDVPEATVEVAASAADGTSGDTPAGDAPADGDAPSVPAVKHDWPAEPGYFGPDGIGDDRPTKRVDRPNTDDPSGGS